jgi:hypothetical protein
MSEIIRHTTLLDAGELSIASFAAAIESFHREAPIEHGVMAIKPDGYGHSGVEVAAREGLAASGLTVVAERDVILMPRDVMELSHREEPELIDYLCSGPCRAFLVRGPSALAATDKLKRALRRRFGVDQRIHNLFHAVDAGKELADWVHRFFPECDEPAARGTADQFWLPPDVSTLREGLAWAAQVHPLGIVIPVIPRAALGAEVFAILCVNGVRWLGVLEAEPHPGLEEFELVRYFPVDADGRPRGEGLTGLGRTTVTRGDYSAMMRAAAAAGLRCILANSEPYTYFEIDLLDEAGAAAGLTLLAGSGASPRPFITANSQLPQETFVRALQGAGASQDQVQIMSD